ncbi:hypothetical protein [Maribellus sediminis]|uniref:hypothetical protein n=1 Tax=Maribellus sediminis TaxID=2696285 RepID=UPI0014312F0B|nr:hypothetical protein [Maribellus sediminis]
MSRIVFLLLVFVITLSTGCDRISNRNSSQQNFGSGNGMGPGNFDPEAMVDRQIERMNETLDLSSDQEKQVRQILMDNFEKMGKMREEGRQGGEGDFEAMREQWQKMREEQNEKMKEVLSDEQWEKYQVYQEEMRARRGQGGQGGPGMPRQ